MIRYDLLKTVEYSAYRNHYLRTLHIDGSPDRDYEIFFPSKKWGEDRPVLIMLHGGGNNTITAIHQTRLHKFGNRNGFVVVYPMGTTYKHRGKGNHLILYWNDGRRRKLKHNQYIDDVDFIFEVVHDLGNICSINKRQVFVAGIDNGARMCHKLALELSGQIKAFAAVAGQVPFPEEDTQFRKVPFIYVHGTIDREMPFTGGILEDECFEPCMIPSVEEYLESWVNAYNVEPVKDSESRFIDYRRWAQTENANVMIEAWLIKYAARSWVSPELNVGKVKYREYNPLHILDTSQLIMNFFLHYI